MTVNDFIFSNASFPRKLRHILFWLAWCIYCYFQEHFCDRFLFENWKVELGRDTITLLNLSTHIFASYVFIYYLMPKYLYNKKYFRLLVGTIILAGGIGVLNYYTDILCFAFQHLILHKELVDINKIEFMRVMSPGLLAAPKVVAASAAIKLSKQWYLQQKQNERIESEKIKLELELLKKQIHPYFLFNALNTVYTYALTASDKAAEMILRLSDVLSYMLYDCDQKMVPLEKEVEILQDYVSLENIRYGEQLDIHLQLNGNTEDKSIAPLLLFPIVENCLKYSTEHTVEQSWIMIDIKMKESMLQFKLTGSQPPNTSVLINDGMKELDDLKKRLEILYPENHELSFLSEKDFYVISLNLNTMSLNTVKNDKYIHSPSINTIF